MSRSLQALLGLAAILMIVFAGYFFFGEYQKYQAAAEQRQLRERADAFDNCLKLAQEFGNKNLNCQP